jgi:hypothetical protein
MKPFRRSDGPLFELPPVAGGREPYNGHAPRVAGDETSSDAADAIEPVRAPSQIDVLAFIRSRGDATDEEIEMGLGRKHQSVSARRRELVQKGYVVDSGLRRMNSTGCSAHVWVVRSIEPKEAT